jgi:hypothetical protein
MILPNRIRYPQFTLIQRMTARRLMRNVPFGERMLRYRQLARTFGVSTQAVIRAVLG